MNQRKQKKRKKKIEYKNRQILEKIAQEMIGISKSSTYNFLDDDAAVSEVNRYKEEVNRSILHPRGYHMIFVPFDRYTIKGYIVPYAPKLISVKFVDELPKGLLEMTEFLKDIPDEEILKALEETNKKFGW